MSAEEKDRVKQLNDARYALGKFESARSILRRHDRPVRDRIADAHLQLCACFATDAPEGSRDELGWILDNITSRPEKLAEMDDGLAEEIAFRNAKFTDTLSEWYEQNAVRGLETPRFRRGFSRC